MISTLINQPYKVSDCSKNLGFYAKKVTKITHYLGLFFVSSRTQPY
jgi:hypothetical protein